MFNLKILNSMNLKKIASLVKGLPEKEKMSILELIDLKSETDMKEIISHLDKLENKIDLKFDSIDLKFDSVEQALKTKYNVLIGMITFIGFVITVISIITKLKG